MTCLITQRFKVYRCESRKPLFKWKVTWNYAYSLRKQSLYFLCAFKIEVGIDRDIQYLENYLTGQNFDKIVDISVIIKGKKGRPQFVNPENKKVDSFFPVYVY